MKIPFIFLFGFFYAISVCGQDPVFNQTDNSRNYLNPAYISTVKSFAADVNYRNQWPELSGSYKTLAVQFNQYLGKGNGVSIHFVNDNAADVILKNEIGVGFAKQLTIKNNQQLSLGVQGSFFQRSLNLDKLVFGDMIDPRRGFVYDTQEATRGGSPMGFDSNAGALYYSKHIFVGYAIHHYTEPNDSFIGGFSRLSIRHGIQIGGKLNWNTVAFVPSVRWYDQANFNAVFVNLKVVWEKLEIDAGVQVKNGIFGGVGFNSNHFNIGYNYTRAINNITNSNLSTHEIRLGCDFKLFKKENEHFFDF